MSKRKPRINIAAVISIIVISAVLTQILFSAFAASNNLTLSASKQTLSAGESTTVTLNAATDREITIAQAQVTYDTSQLQLTNVNYANSPLNTDSPDASSGNGVRTISRYKAGPPYPTGSIFIAQLTFKALVNTGSSNISINQGNSALFSAEDASNILASVSGANINFGSTSTGGGSSGGGGSGSKPSPAPPSSNPSSPSGGSDGSGDEGEGANTGDTGNSDESQKFQSFATVNNDDSNIPKPGSSQLGAQQGLVQRMLSFIRAIAPFAIILGLISLVTFIAVKRLAHKPHGFSPTETHVAANTGPAGPGSGVLIGTSQQKSKNNQE